MTRISEIYSYIDSIAPFDTAMDFDNAGLLCGDMNGEVTRALVCLDITRAAVLEAESLGCELIISHHPIIFKPVKSVPCDSVPYMLAQRSISAICAHTNLDLSPVGTNAQLAKLLGLGGTAFVDGEGLVVGEVEEEMTALEFARYIKERLGCGGLRYTDSGKSVKTVAICTGAGGDMVYAANGRADALITGEIKHHELIDADKAGLSVFDIGHYRSEFIVCAPFAEMLQKRFAEVGFTVSSADRELTNYI